MVPVSAGISCQASEGEKLYFTDLSIWLADGVRPHLVKVAMALVATTLFLYGGHIHAAVRKSIQGLHFVIRVLILIAVVAFGYGALSVVLALLLADLLATVSSAWLVPTILIAVLVLGILAERKNKI